MVNFEAPLTNDTISNEYLVFTGTLWCLECHCSFAHVNISVPAVAHSFIYHQDIVVRKQEKGRQLKVTYLIHLHEVCQPNFLCQDPLCFPHSKTSAAPLWMQTCDNYMFTSKLSSQAEHTHIVTGADLGSVTKVLLISYITPLVFWVYTLVFMEDFKCLKKEIMCNTKLYILSIL